MFNEWLHIGPFTIYGYGVMTAVGILAAYFTAEYRAKKKGLDHERVFGMVISCLIFGYLGSKILFFITILPEIIADPSVILRSFADGWVMYGGLIGGIIGGLIFLKWKKLPVWKFFDLGLTSVILAQGFGRIGCFFAGCCYGKETDSWCHIVFHNSGFAPNDVALYPTQLMMSLGDFLLFFFLILYDKKKVSRRDGEITGLYLLLYSVGRFIIEFFRGDEGRGSVGALSTSQFIGIFLAIAGLIVWLMRRRSTPAVMCMLDLDGTLIDSVAAIAHACNEGLKECGLPEQEVEKYKYFVGDGFKTAIERALKAAGDEELENYDKAYEKGLEVYFDDPLYENKPYEGMKEALEALKKKGVKLTVCSNKPHPLAGEVVEKYYGTELFDKIQGHEKEGPKKPDPSVPLALIREYGIEKNGCVYVGDTDTDMKTGKNAGFYTVGALWGFRTKEELEENKADIILEKPSEIEELITKRFRLR